MRLPRVVSSAVALLLASCSEGAIGPAGPPGPPGPEGPPGGTSEVASLRAELAALRGELAMVQARSVKVPHLVVAATGQDLGIAVPRGYWSEVAGGPVLLNHKRSESIVYGQPGCKGPGAITSLVELPKGTLVVSPWMTLLTFSPGSSATRANVSQDIFTGGQRRCIELDAGASPLEGVDFVDTKIPAGVYAESEISVELR